MTAYYNEIEPYAAQWLRNLIAAGLIPAGDVDERRIELVEPDDLEGYAQCHFFAGIGGWALAARLAGWPDSRELWTGSPPCQPFSVAGQGKAQADDRHLWPHLFRLARARRPAVLMGEQVAAAVGKDWLDGVFADLEGIDYACGAVVVPACAVDAPHRRDRLWFVADANGAGLEGRELLSERGSEWPAGPSGLEYVAMAHTDSLARRQIDQDARGCANGSGARKVAGLGCARAGDVADSHESRPHAAAHPGVHRCEEGTGSRDVQPFGHRSAWNGADWLIGHDGKARRFEPSIRLLVDGSPARVGRLRAYGNAIVPQVAAEVIGAYLDTRVAA